MNFIKSFLIITFLALFIACQPVAQRGRPVSNAPDIRVQIGEVSNLDSIRFDGDYILKAPEAQYELGASAKLYLRKDSKGYRFYNGNRLFLLRSDDQISFISKSENALLVYHKKSYRGGLHIQTNADGTILLINLLPLDNYLRSVVPSEIFTNRADDIEAIKAQAVCARSYALQKMKTRPGQPFDVYGDTRDQAYNGYNVESVLGNQAVAETRGSVLMYDGKIAKTYFHACDGGISEDPGDVWSGVKLPYLQVRQDVWADSFACRGAPIYRWEKTFTIDQLDSLFNQAYHVSYKDSSVKDTTRLPFEIKIMERSASGRVKKMQVSYGNNQQVLNGFSIRRFFGSPDGKAMPSTLFRVASNDSLITFTGAGFGHGVGLCQYGALYKAEKGLKFYHILQTYYPGTNLEKIY